MNLVLKGKLREAVLFVCEQERGVVFQPSKLAEDFTGTLNETVASVLKGKHPHKNIPSCATLEMYDKMLFKFPSTSRRTLSNQSRKNFWGIQSQKFCTDLEALDGWLLNFLEDRK